MNFMNNYGEYFPMLYMCDGEVIRIGYNDTKEIPSGDYCLLPLLSKTPDIIFTHYPSNFTINAGFEKGEYYLVKCREHAFDYWNNRYIRCPYTDEEIETINKIWNDFYDIRNTTERY